VRARDVPVGEVQGTPVRLETLSATLSGLRLPLTDALSGTVTAVPVDRVEARALLPFAVFARSSDDRELTVAPEDGRLRVSGSVQVLGQELTGSALSSLVLDGEEAVVTAESFDVGGELANRVLTRTLRDRFDVRLDLAGLPYDLVVQALSVQPDGVAVTARARDTVLSASPG
jgi:hypothetical protein